MPCAAAGMLAVGPVASSNAQSSSRSQVVVGVAAWLAGFVEVAVSWSVSPGCDEAGETAIATVGMRSRIHWLRVAAPMRV